MFTESRVINALKIFLAGLFFLFTVLQTLSFPGQFAYMAKTSPNDASLRWPLTFLVGFMFLCAQVIIVSVWKLLNLIKTDQVFTSRSLANFDRIIYSIGAASLFPIGILIFLFFNADDPGLPMVIITFLTALGVLFLIVILLKLQTQKVIALLKN
ncbi:MAG: hypothetical protein RIR66_123 [Actinomycetota bacterium]